MVAAPPPGAVTDIDEATAFVPPHRPGPVRRGDQGPVLGEPAPRVAAATLNPELDGRAAFSRVPK